MTDMYSLLHPTLQFIGGLFEVERVSVVTLDGNETLSVKAGIGLGEEIFKPMKLKENRVSAYVMETGKSLMVEDIRKDERFKPNLNSYRDGAFCSAPLRMNGQVIGVVNLSNRKTKEHFNEEELNVLSKCISHLVELLEKRNEKVSSSPVYQPPIDMDEQFVGDSEKIREIKQLILSLANTDLSVFVRGETGTGKGIVAKLLHDCSERRKKPFIKVNCASLPETLLEAELFGYERGAFTGAYVKKPGKFEIANHGTILLDEIGEMDPKLQAKLLQVLEDKEYPRIGGKDNVKVDVRIVAASNVDIEKALVEKSFRRDLFYRLNEVTLCLPPLRERKEDIPLLVEHFLKRYNAQYKRNTPMPEYDTIEFLKCYSWLGNIRELENLVKRYAVLGDENILKSLEIMEPSPEIIGSSPEKIEPYPQMFGELQHSGLGLLDIGKLAAAEAEKQVIVQALNETKWSKGETATLLKINRRTLSDKIKTYGIGNGNGKGESNEILISGSF